LGMVGETMRITWSALERRGRLRILFARMYVDTQNTQFLDSQSDMAVVASGE
jgi:hypothetical protein